MLRDANRATHIKRRASVRQIADHAIDRAAAELDCFGPENAVSRCGSVVIHSGKSTPKI
jgi:hypothetical protein